MLKRIYVVIIINELILLNLIVLTTVVILCSLMCGMQRHLTEFMRILCSRVNLLN